MDTKVPQTNTCDAARYWLRSNALGYGAGLGFFFKNFKAVCEVEEYQVFSIDWIGMGNSSRPLFPSSHECTNEQEHTEKAEAFFIDALEAWRQKMQLEKMVLLGKPST